MAETFDVVIIGSGPGGYVGAIRAAQLGLKTAIIEKDKRLGGTCLHRGCIPTKSLLWTASLFHHIKESSDFGIDVANPTVNWANAQKHKDKVVTKGANGIDFLMKKNKITVVKGHGRIAGKGKVEVTAEDGSKQTLETKNIIIATGSVPKSLPNVAVDHKRVMNSDSILTIDRIPKSIIVLGAGAVGCEFASVFNHVGSKTAIVEYMPALLPIEDADISKELDKIFRRRGIDVHTGSAVQKVEHTADGVRVTMKVGEETKTLEAEILLSAVGRAPVTEDVGLNKTSIQVDRGFIKVDTLCRTSEPNVYAIGDVIPTPMLAHMASAECVMVVEHIAGKNPAPINYDLTPSATYCYPEVASVGLTEKKAKERGYDVKVGIAPFGAVTKSAISNESVGLIKIVSDKKYDEVLGIHIIGPHATELLAEACVAMKLEITTEELAHTIHAHPTLSEIMHEGAEATLGHPLHF
ncbi:dihydrolipoyl dehydrogenase [Corallococcus sp. CA054B]|uniref:Dihydrolipoyl dehydrogenase n=1 Tax=Corallococcus coralloides (strain ATCC 25202 / DSM 2259 / NBRC 100086 / M2) TaxID=1144275 RepID=H8MPQ4_CORCM|nr:MULTISPECIES: dihydrolipoyl dehydrogenase [Corallococcus]AFE09247.1 alpha keto acid dehydrogenase complex, E3 component, lipoamide dehydrogenase [Corallococcus coralloides DSM 2259]RKG56646.1 dihydrolipoyl dehydrogenase [Corallococcus sp. CA054B]